MDEVVVDIVSMVVTTVTVFAMVQDDHHFCLIFPKVSSKSKQDSLFCLAPQRFALDE